MARRPKQEILPGGTVIVNWMDEGELTLYYSKSRAVAITPRQMKAAADRHPDPHLKSTVLPEPEDPQSRTARSRAVMKKGTGR